MDKIKEGNQRLTIAEWWNVLKRYDAIDFPLFGKGDIVTFMGKRVLRQNGEIVLFDVCEYCRNKEIKDGLHNQYVCCSCGAPV